MTPSPPRLDAAPPSTTRRRLLKQGLGILAAAPWLADAATTAASPLRLPLHLVQLVNHIGTAVPDVAKSATFYSHLFDGARILGQRKPALRYEINFFPGALSIGPLSAAAGGPKEHALIDHFCVVAQPFDGAAWRARLDRDQVRYFAGGSFVNIGGVAVQLFGARVPTAKGKRGAGKAPPGGGFAPMPPLYTGQPLVKAHGFEHLMLHVSDLRAASGRFRTLFGLTPLESSPGRIFFRVGTVRVGLEQAASGEKPGIAAFAIKVAAFDPGRVGQALEALGARVEPAERSGKRTILRFADPDGIRSELWTI
jgi:catechol 2,3-dioxygenase-like lactoylglutathione lyase family enzyme